MKPVETRRLAISPEAFALFSTLLPLDGAEREQRLASLKLDRPALHPQVASLLEADRRAQTAAFLSGPSLADEAVSPNPLPVLPTRQPGDRYGVWLLERPLGSGGMGEVWLARRADGLYEAATAIKLLHPHLAASGVRERFARERRILSKLEHPNIARLIDAGISSEGALYLVLEYIEGDRLDDWCDQRQLPLAERLAQFITVCAAVSHAHAQLVVHRDLKPSNILVTASGVPKLLDFGIAKLVEDGSGEADTTELTRIEGRVLTPEYAAPEQLRGEPITTVTDVYALGGLLYRLLAGAPPYPGTATRLAEIQPLVLEAESLPLSEAPARSAAGIDETARQRGTQPAALNEALRGDLQNICAKALKKLPAERYASVAALADDVRRHLDHLPVLARADSLPYRARKFLRRHRLAVAAAAGLTISLLGGLAVSTTLYLRAEAASRRADAKAAEAQAVNQFLLRDMLVAADPNAGGGDVTARELLDRALRGVDERFAAQPLLRGEVLATIGNSYVNLGAFDAARGALEMAITLLSTHAGAADPQTLRAQSALMTLNHEQDDGLGAARLAEAIRAHAATGSPETLYAEAMQAYGACKEGHYQDCLRKLDEVAADLAAAKPLPADHPLRFVLPNFRAEALMLNGRMTDAVDTAGEAVRNSRATVGERHPYTLIASAFQGFVLVRSYQAEAAEPLLAEAEAIATQTLGPDHFVTLNLSHNRVLALNMLKRWTEAEPLARMVYQRELAMLGETHVETRRSLHNLAAISLALGRYDEALTDFTRAWQLDAAQQGSNHPQTLVTRNAIGLVYRRQHRYAEAEAVHREVLTAARAVEARPRNEVKYLMSLAAVLFDQARNDEAQRTLDEATTLANAQLSDGNPLRKSANAWQAQIAATGPTPGYEPF